jgi:hypothetical protein
MSGLSARCASLNMASWSSVEAGHRIHQEGGLSFEDVVARIEAELAAVRPLTVRCGVDLNHLFRVAAARLPDEASPLLDRLAVLIGAALRDELRAPGTGKK